MSELINGRTAEEIKARLACCSKERGCHVCPDVADSDCSLKLCADALALIERLEAAQPKWISVEEQSEPQQDGEYWCFGYWIGSGRKQTGTAEYLSEWKISNNFVMTHWMPLPEEPKEGAR